MCRVCFSFPSIVFPEIREQVEVALRHLVCGMLLDLCFEWVRDGLGTRLRLKAVPVGTDTEVDVPLLRAEAERIVGSGETPAM